MASSILCDNALTNSSIVSGGTVEFPFSNCINGSTALQASFDDTINVVILDLGQEKAIDSFAIAKHNIFTASGGSGRIVIQGGDSEVGPWYEGFDATIPSDSVFVHTHTSTITTQYLRLEINNAIGSNIDMFIGNLFVGKKLQLSDGQYVGFISPNYATAYKMRANVTRGGEVAGIIRQPEPIKCKIEAKHVSKAWLDANWHGIRECITRYPFYFEWDENEQAMYAWAESIDPPKWTKINRLEFSISAEGFI